MIHVFLFDVNGACSSRFFRTIADVPCDNTCASKILIRRNERYTFEPIGLELGDVIISTVTESAERIVYICCVCMQNVLCDSMPIMEIGNNINSLVHLYAVKSDHIKLHIYNSYDPTKNFARFSRKVQAITDIVKQISKEYELIVDFEPQV